MTERRDFLKIALSTTAGATAFNATGVFAGTASLPPGLIYTEANPGKWAKKVNSHLPVVEVADGKVTVTTNHGMSEEHFIVRHTLVTRAGEVVGENTFSPDDENAVSMFDLPAGETAFYATSFCNKHDLWVAAFSV